ncbi:hypothetical protein [Endozoicomonas lisbonensis]|uniref:hypothetical protein n=1 Tax=Endozoicomonas lisbonensis TaxID=3120522 RepID=UPI003391CD00
MEPNSPLDPKGYVPGYFMNLEVADNAGDKGVQKITVEVGTLKQLGTNEDYCTVSHPKKELDERVTSEVAVPLGDLELSSVLSSTEATRDYVATTDNKKLALSQLIEAIKSKKSGKEREDYLFMVFSAKKVDQWAEYIKEIVEGNISVKESGRSQRHRNSL